MPLNNEIDILNMHNVDNDIKDAYTRAMIAVEEKENYSTQRYVKNQYLIWKDRRLYKALTPINIGDTFVEDNNIKHVGFITDELFELYSQSSDGVKELIGNVEEANASKAYGFGDYIILAADGRLYLVTNNVSLGTVWREGINIEHVDNISVLITDLDRGLHKTNQMLTFVEPTNIASQSYPVGVKLILDGVVYKVTTHIEQGGRIVPNGNVVQARHVINMIDGDDLTYGTYLPFALGNPLWTTDWSEYNYIELYLAIFGITMQCVRLYTGYSAHTAERKYSFSIGQIDGGDTATSLRQLVATFSVSGRYLSGLKVYMNYSGRGSTPGAWTDITNDGNIHIHKVVGYKS